MITQVLSSGGGGREGGRGWWSRRWVCILGSRVQTLNKYEWQLTRFCHLSVHLWSCVAFKATEDRRRSESFKHQRCTQLSLNKVQDSQMSWWRTAQRLLVNMQSKTPALSYWIFLLIPCVWKPDLESHFLVQTHTYYHHKHFPCIGVFLGLQLKIAEICTFYIKLQISIFTARLVFSITHCFSNHACEVCESHPEQERLSPFTEQWFPCIHCGWQGYTV